MFKKYIFFIFLLSFFSSINAQNAQLSVYSEISIITSGPGDFLYEKFGHTAIRVKDPVLNLDLLYNYGIFDFSDPAFYSNFVKGYMKYKLARYPFYLALKSANNDQRWVKQQVLNLTIKERNELFILLETNAQPKNASYFYDPFFDNCATRPRDLIIETLKGQFILKEDFIKTPKSLRNLMNEMIHPNTWGSFGINIALGSKLDKIATPEEYLYLPEYLFLALEDSKINKDNKEINAVLKTTTLLDFKRKIAKSDTPSPFLILSLIFLLVCFITYSDFKKKKRSRILDFTLFLSSGLIGVLIVFLWGFTNHSTAPNNFNFLWGFAPNIILAFYALKPKAPNFLKKYIMGLIGMLLLIPIIHILKIQQFTYPFIPLLLIFTIRYIYFYYIQKMTRNNST